MASESRRLTEMVAVRFTKDDFDALQSAARARGMTVPAFLRRAGLDRVDAAPVRRALAS